MTGILTKLKLIDNLSMELDLPIQAFNLRLQNIIETGDISGLSNVFDAFTPGSKNYRGEQTNNRFKIKQKDKLFGTKPNWAIAIGTINEFKNGVKLNIQVSALQPRLLKIMVINMVIVLAFLISLFASSFANFIENPQGIIMPMVIIIVVSFLPILLLRTGVKKLIHDLESELRYISN